MIEPASPPVDPLVGNARRQAVHSIEGYDYQIWRAAEAWLGLRSDEALFIEGAEDYDVVGPGGATANQVKNSPEDISLGSADVIETIANYWRMRQDNSPHARLNLRYLARGSVRSEKGSVFGARKGLDVWRSAAGGDDDDALLVLRQLRRRVADPSLSSFLALVEERQDFGALREQLIARIEWLVDQPDLDMIRRVVKQLVVQHGQTQDISADRCEAAIPSLLEHCREVSVLPKPEHRRLTQADFHGQFTSAISISVPVTNSTERLLAQVLFAGSAEPPLRFNASRKFDRPPPIPADPIERECLAASIAAALAGQGAALVAGTAGRGKSAAVALAAIAGGGRPMWIELEDLDGQSAASALESVLAELRVGREGGVVAIDGLPDVAALPRALWLRFRDLLGECRRLGRPLLASAQGVNSAQIDPLFLEEGVAVIMIPDIGSDEIERYFLGLGCPPGMAKPWALLAAAHSGGHPKLLHARGRELKRLGWPPPSADASGAPGPSIEAARSSARAIVARSFPDGDRELLYGLSLAMLNFDRAVAMGVAASLGLDGSPGDSFDRLVGSWIDERGSDAYRASALLTGQSSLAWPQDKVERVHGAICEAFMLKKSLRVDQSLPILRHALESKDPRLLSGFVGGVIRSDAMLVPGLAEYLAPFARIADEPGQILFPTCRATSLAARVFQFKLALANPGFRAAAIAQAWRWEIDHAEVGEFDPASAAMWGVCVASSGAEDIPIEMALLAIAEVDRGKPIFAALAEEQGKSPVAALRAGKDDITASLMSFANRKARSAELLGRLLDALTSTDADIRRAMLGAFDIGYMRDSHQFLTSAYLGECNAPEPDWGRFMAECARADALAMQWSCPKMSISSLRVRAAALSEKLGDDGAAIALLEEGLSRHPGSNDLLCQIAEVHFNAGRHRQALAIYELSLDKRLDRPEANTYPYAMRHAALSCHALGDFAGAAQWFESGAGAARRVGGLELAELSAGLDLDAAHCWVLACSWRSAIIALARAHAVVAAPVDRAESPILYAMREMARRVIAWACAMAGVGVPKPEEPIAGMCSNANMRWEMLPDTDRLFDTASAGLVLAARARRVALPELSSLRMALEQSSEPMVYSMMWILRVQDQLRSGGLEFIAASLANVALGNWRAAALRRMGLDVPVFDPRTMEVAAADRAQIFDFRATLAAACLLRALEGGTVATLAEAWLSSLARVGHSEWLAAQVVAVKSSAAGDFIQAKAIAFDGSSPLLAKLGAAIVVLADPRRSPLDTAWCQVGFLYWAIMLDTSYKQFLLAEADLLADRFCALWRGHLAQPSLLDDPVAGIPLLADAIQSTGSGAERLTRLFKAVEVAAAVRLPKELLEALEASAWSAMK